MRQVKRMSQHGTFLIDTDLKAVPSFFVVLLDVFLAARRKEAKEPRRISRRIIASCFTLSDCITAIPENVLGRTVYGIAGVSPQGLRVQ